MRARAAAALGFLVGLGALLLQLSLTIPARMDQGHNLLDALLFFFTFFTILTNLMLVLIYASVLFTAPWLAWWRSPVTRGMMAGAITLVMVFYHFILAATWSPQGWFAVADGLLHYVTPVFYVAWWLLFQPKGLLRPRDIGAMLVPPLIWLAWTMLRGAMVTEYPYAILEAHTLGYPQVALNILLVLGSLLLLFGAVLGLDRLLGRNVGDKSRA